jgi:hypothetical protein
LTAAIKGPYRQSMQDPKPLLDRTMHFVLSGIEAELRPEIDWRAAGRGKNIFRRAAIYSAGMVRDLVRIPSHHPEGIAQARFRARIRSIERTALPTVRFFLDTYPLSGHQRENLSSAVAELSGCVDLISDGRFHALDEWYATMDEFADLTQRSRRAADAIAAAIGEGSGPDIHR